MITYGVVELQRYLPTHHLYYKMVPNMRKYKRCLLSGFILAIVTTLMMLNITDFRNNPNRNLAKYTENSTEATNDSDNDWNDNPHVNNLNIPYEFWKENKDKPLYFKNKTCARFPDVLDLDYNNVHWQNLYTSGVTFHLLSAHYDNRTLNPTGRVVRIIGVANVVDVSVKAVCQLWFENQTQPVFSDIIQYQSIWKNSWGGAVNGTNMPYLMTCKIPRNMKEKLPAAVSVVERKCDDATNAFKVHYSSFTEKKDFVVCVKGLDFSHKDLSNRMIEWIELLGILGAHKIVLYELQTHPSISKVLQFYRSTGQIEVFPLTLPGVRPNEPFLRHIYLTNRIMEKRKNEIIPYNDCFYRNMNKYKYVVIMDIDEVIIPVQLAKWAELMKKTVNVNIPRSSYVARNVYFLDDMLHSHGFFDDIPRHLHMLQHVYRTVNFSKPGAYIKGFHDTNMVHTVHNHFPISCLQHCNPMTFDVHDAQLQHYREDCVVELKEVCHMYRKNTKVDSTLWRYKEELIRRTDEVRKKLGLS